MTSWSQKNGGRSITRGRIPKKSSGRTWTTVVSVLFLGRMEDGSQATRKQARWSNSVDTSIHARGGSWSNVSIGIDLGLPYFIFIKINYIFINPPVRFPRRNAAAAAGDQEEQLVERRVFLHYTSLGFLKSLPHAVLNWICMLSNGIKNFYGWLQGVIVGEHPWNWGRFVPFWDEKVNEIMKHLC